MKRLPLLLLFAAAALPAAGLTLPRARELALENNPGIVEAAERIRAAEARLTQARSAFLPTVAANAGYQQLDIRQHSDDFPERIGDLAFDQYTFGIQGTWLLFNGFAREATHAAAREGVLGAEEGRKEAERLILKAVTVAFHQAQLARENMLIATRDQEFNENLHADALKRYQAEQVAESTVLNFRIRTIQAKTTRLAAERGFRLAGTVLAELMALPRAELPADLQPVPADEAPPNHLPDLDAQIERALAARPDLRAIEAGIRAAEEQVRAARAAHWPTLALTAGYDYEHARHLAPFHLNNKTSRVGVVAVWDIFAGGLHEGAIAEAKAQVRQLAQQRQRLILAIAAELRQYHDSAATALATLELQQEACGLSARVRDDVQKAYQAGSTTLTRLNEAQTDLVRAEGSLAAARIQLRQILEEFQLAAGTAR